MRSTSWLASNVPPRARIAHQSTVLGAGRLPATGFTSLLAADGRYARMFHLQATHFGAATGG